MTGTNDWNASTIAEFRANEGRVGGAFEGAPITLVHHRGRRSGREYVSPMMYLADDDDAMTIYVFGSKAGAPTHPDWYYNLRSAGLAQARQASELAAARARKTFRRVGVRRTPGTATGIAPRTYSGSRARLNQRM